MPISRRIEPMMMSFVTCLVIVADDMRWLCGNRKAGKLDFPGQQFDRRGDDLGQTLGGVKLRDFGRR